MEQFFAGTNPKASELDSGNAAYPNENKGTAEMTGDTYTPGGDAKAIATVANRFFDGYAAMFEHHGWPERGADMMRKVQTRVVETYGSVRAFEDQFSEKASSQAQIAAPDCWTDQTSVLLTSYWGWSPEDWGTVGWSLDRGKTRRDNLLKELTDPFITVVYVTKNKSDVDPDLKRKIAGFYLVSHETGDRDDFTHPIHHYRNPEKWRHSLRAIRAFTYLPEYRFSIEDVFPEILPRVLPVAAMGEVITDIGKIERLRTCPWVEVPVYASGSDAEPDGQGDNYSSGMVRPGPNNSGGYQVPSSGDGLPRELYVLRLQGDTDAFLGRSAMDQSIHKIGLSASPDMRRQALQKSMPRGSFKWIVERTTRRDGHIPYSGYSTAVAGETAMKVHLARNGLHLGGEFYLCTNAVIEDAWEIGRDAALALQVKENL